MLIDLNVLLDQDYVGLWSMQVEPCRCRGPQAGSKMATLKRMQNKGESHC